MKRSFRIAALFSSLVFFILLVSMFFITLVSILLFHSGISNLQTITFILVLFAVISILVGIVLFKILGKKPLESILAMNKAARDVARGNFKISLSEDIYVNELSEMAHNFNIMAGELANTEMFRNDFIENVSHEFKTPLSAIEGYATLLQNKSISEEKRDAYIEKIILNTTRLSTLTGNILLLSRLEHQKIGIEKQMFSLDEQLREIILLFEEQWTQKQSELDIDLCNSEFYGNKEMLYHVWQNIIGNAMKFVPDQGIVHITLRQDQFCIKVSISDNGAGINDEIKNRIFEKFYQGDLSRSSSGNGLGLTLAKRIVELHSGTIEVYSEEGKGTTFTVMLPV